MVGSAVIGGAAAIGLGLGTAAGLIFNWASENSLEDSNKRMKKAKKEPKYAKWMMDMFCFSRGHLCGRNAPDGWQVECKSGGGGLVQGEETSVTGGWEDLKRVPTGADTWARAAKGFFSEARAYKNPWGYRDLEQHDRKSFSKEDVLEIMAYMGILFDEDKKKGKTKIVPKQIKGKKVLVNKLLEGSLLKQYESCYRSIEGHAAAALPGKQHDKYVVFQHMFGIDYVAEKKEFKGVDTSKAGVAATKVATENSEQIKEVQKALIEFFGPELEAKLGDEYTQGVIGKNTKYAFSNFTSDFGSDPDFPKGKGKLKKLPKFIRQMIAEKEFKLAQSDTEIGTMVAESKMNLQQKRLLKMNKRLMKL